ncbi:MAG: hypothetical protein MUO89_03765 [Dehalococcoidia bacterium]|nr:hypothetical protein [Dehalococcoidia bacterium]
MKYSAFDQQAFEAEVKKDVGPVYGVDNECTRFYEAMAKVEGVAAQWQFTDKQAEKDCWRYILILANRCFSKIWGLTDNNGKLREEGALKFAKDHLNDPTGAPNTPQKWKGCHWPDIEFKARMIGMQFYKGLLDLRHAEKKFEELGGVVSPPTGEEIVRAIINDEHLDIMIKNALVNLVQALYPDKG